ncbi:MAG: hypothetical protein M3Q70_02865 [bacterium]|nr:hypothetical protein [bacterium]
MINKHIRKPKLNKRNLAICMMLIFAVIITTYTLNRTYSSKRTNNSAKLSNTDNLIQSSQQLLSEDPNNANLYTNLCQNYLQKIRENADTTYYAECTKLLDKAVVIDPGNAEVYATQAAVAYGKHSFSEGLSLAQKALELNPDKVYYYGLLADGQIELGDYESATKSVQTMVDKKPELSSYNRVAYIRELYGDIEGAKAALVTAISSGSSFLENVAFSQVELGKLHLRDDLAKATDSFSEALRTYNDYPPALEGLGKVAFANGDNEKAIEYYQKAFNVLPLAQYATGLGDIYITKGDSIKADQYYYLSQLAFDKSTSGGVNNDFEFAIFLAQRNKDISKSVELANKSVIVRPNIFTYDALAWAQYQSANYSEAQLSINKALGLGEHQPVILYHASLIAEKLGQIDIAKVYLEEAFSKDKYFLEQHFSLLDRIQAKEALERINKL